ncbi:hypothetical protein FRC17_010998 [Serendipita sp. 399]|nr:hypothetical protein FRC17_010998 [Serendipita sp. 399]
MDATLSEILLTLRGLSSPSPSHDNPSQGTSAQDAHLIHSHLAKYTFRAIYPDPSAGGRFESRELGVVFSKDLCEPSVLTENFEPSWEGATKSGDAKGGEAEEEMKADSMEETTEQAIVTRPPKDTSPPAESNANQDATGTGTHAKSSSSRENRTLSDLRFRQGDYLSISVVLPPQPGSGSGGGGIGTGAGAGAGDKSGGGGNLNIRGRFPG